jgi:hypothetical protein
MIGAFISTNDTYLHSWGVIFVQDVVLPFRKQPLSPEQAPRAAAPRDLRRRPLRGALQLLLRAEPVHLDVSRADGGTVFVGGAGSAIIGGLYWKKGTHARGVDRDDRRACCSRASASSSSRASSAMLLRRFLCRVAGHLSAAALL